MINSELLFDFGSSDFATFIITHIKNMLDYQVKIVIGDKQYFVEDSYNEKEDIYTLSLYCKDRETNSKKELIHLTADGVDGPTPSASMSYEELVKYNNPDHLYILANDNTELFLSFIQISMDDIADYLYEE